MTKNLPRWGKKTPTSLSLSETFVFNFEKKYCCLCRLSSTVSAINNLLLLARMKTERDRERWREIEKEGDIKRESRVQSFWIPTSVRDRICVRARKMPSHPSTKSLNYARSRLCIRTFVAYTIPTELLFLLNFVILQPVLWTWCNQ